MSTGTGRLESAYARIENDKSQIHKEPSNGHELWTDGLLCAFEFIRHRGKRSYTKSGLKMRAIRRSQSEELDNQNQQPAACGSALLEGTEGINEYALSKKQTTTHILENHWVPIAWERIFEHVKSVQVDEDRFARSIDISDDDDDFTVADIAAPYWEKPAGPTWWCHVIPTHPNVDSLLRNAQWLHPAISTTLRDESRLIKERFSYFATRKLQLFYGDLNSQVLSCCTTSPREAAKEKLLEGFADLLNLHVPVRVAGGLLFELLGQSVGDPFSHEDDIPIVLRSWQAQNILLTALYVKGVSSNINVLEISEVQDLLLAGGSKVPKSAHELVAYLASRLTRWNDK